jgi:hypothetical protein
MRNSPFVKCIYDKNEKWWTCNEWYDNSETHFVNHNNTEWQSQLTLNFEHDFENIGHLCAIARPIHRFRSEPASRWFRKHLGGWWVAELGTSIGEIGHWGSGWGRFLQVHAFGRSDILCRPAAAVTINKWPIDSFIHGCQVVDLLCRRRPCRSAPRMNVVYRAHSSRGSGLFRETLSLNEIYTQLGAASCCLCATRLDVYLIVLHSFRARKVTIRMTFPAAGSMVTLFLRIPHPGMWRRLLSWMLTHLRSVVCQNSSSLTVKLCHSPNNKARLPTKLTKSSAGQDECTSDDMTWTPMFWWIQQSQYCSTSTVYMINSWSTWTSTDLCQQRTVTNNMAASWITKFNKEAGPQVLNYLEQSGWSSNQSFIKLTNWSSAEKIRYLSARTSPNYRGNTN